MNVPRLVGLIYLEKEAFVSDLGLIRCAVGMGQGDLEGGGVMLRHRPGERKQSCRECYLSNMNDKREVT